MIVSRREDMGTDINPVWCFIMDGMMQWHYNNIIEDDSVIVSGPPSSNR